MLITPAGPLPPALLAMWDPLEQDFQRVLYLYGRNRGWLIFATRDARHSPSGEPDLRMYRGTRIIMAELKRNERDLAGHKRQVEQSLAQIAAADVIRATGKIEVYLWRPSDWNRICEVLW